MYRSSHVVLVRGGAKLSRAMLVSREGLTTRGYTNGFVASRRLRRDRPGQARTVPNARADWEDDFSSLADREDRPPLQLPVIKKYTRVVLVRHGESTWNAENRLQGSSNESVLTEKARASVSPNIFPHLPNQMCVNVGLTVSQLDVGPPAAVVSLGSFVILSTQGKRQALSTQQMVRLQLAHRICRSAEPSDKRLTPFSTNSWILLTSTSCFSARSSVLQKLLI